MIEEIKKLYPEVKFEEVDKFPKRGVYAIYNNRQIFISIRPEDELFCNQDMTNKMAKISIEHLKS